MVYVFYVSFLIIYFIIINNIILFSNNILHLFTLSIGMYSVEYVLLERFEVQLAYQIINDFLLIDTLKYYFFVVCVVIHLLNRELYFI